MWRPAGTRVYRHWAEQMTRKKCNVRFEGGLTVEILERHFGYIEFRPWDYANDSDHRNW
jgi:hypothetical protein